MLTIDSKSLKTENIIVASVQHESVAPTNINAISLARNDGQKLISTNFGAKEIVITGTIINDSQNDFEQELDDFKRDFTVIEKNLVRDFAGGYRKYIVTTKSISIARDTYNIDFAPFELVLVALDPFGVECDIDGNDIITIPYTKTTSRDLETETIVLSGTTSPTPKIKFTFTAVGDVTSFDFSNQTTGGQITITPTAIAAGDIFVIDTAKKKVTQNGEEINFVGSIPRFIVGSNVIMYDFYATSGVTLVASQLTNNNFKSFWGTRKLAQSFTYSATSPIPKMSLILSKVGNPTGDITISIQTDNSDAPSGTVVTNGTITITPEEIQNNSYWINRNFQNLPSVTSSTKYWFVLSTVGGDVDNYYKLHANSAGGYANGTAKQYVSSWTLISGYDFCFKLYNTTIDQSNTNILDDVVVAFPSSSNDTSVTTASWDEDRDRIELYKDDSIMIARNMASDVNNDIACSSDGLRVITTLGNTSSDGGITWNNSTYNVDCNKIACSSNGNVIARTGFNGPIVVSNDFGLTWNNYENNRYWGGICMSSTGAKMYACVSGMMIDGEYVDGGYIYASTNYGVNWSLVSNTLKKWSGISCSSDGTKIVAIAEGGGIYISTDSGLNWNLKASPPDDVNWSDVCASSDFTKLAACINNGSIYTSSDSGETWTERATNKQWRSISCSSDGVKLVATPYSDYIYTSSNSGVTWNAQDNNTRLWWSSAISSDGKYIIATAERVYTNGYNTSLKIAQSMLLDSISSLIYSATERSEIEIPTGTSIVSQLSSDGTNFETVTNNVEHIFTAVGSGLKMKKTLNGTTSYTPVVLDSNINYKAVLALKIGTDKIAQSFIPSASYSLSRLSINLAKIGSPGNLTVSICSDNAGSPGTVLSTKDFSIDNFSLDWISFLLTTPVSVVSTSSYWIVLSGANCDANNYFVIRTKNGNLYSLGALKFSNAGGAYSTYTNEDICFITYKGTGNIPSVGVSIEHPKLYL